MESTDRSTNQAGDAAKQAAAQASEVVSTAAARTGDVATTATDGGKWVAAVGQEQAKSVTTAATDQVGHVAAEVGAQARSLLDESRDQLRTQARTQTEQIAGKLRELGGQVQALVDGRVQEAGPVGDYARRASETVAQFADRVEQRGFDGLVADAQRFARRRPGTFLIGAALAGFGVGRLLRAGAMDAHPQPAAGSPDGDAYDAYASLGMSTQPPLVDVTDGSVAGMASLDPPPGTMADVDATSPGGSGAAPGAAGGSTGAAG